MGCRGAPFPGEATLLLLTSGPPVPPLHRFLFYATGRFIAFCLRYSTHDRTYYDASSSPPPSFCCSTSHNSPATLTGEYNFFLSPQRVNVTQQSAALRRGQRAPTWTFVRAEGEKEKGVQE